MGSHARYHKSRVTVAEEPTRWTPQQIQDWLGDNIVAYREWYEREVKNSDRLSKGVVIGTGVATFVATVTAAAAAPNWITAAFAAFATLLTGLGLDDITTLRETGLFRVTILEQRAKIELSTSMTEEQRSRILLGYLDQIVDIERDYGRPATKPQPGQQTQLPLQPRQSTSLPPNLVTGVVPEKYRAYPATTTITSKRSQIAR